MFQFPPNPTLGQQFAPTVGVTYEWNGTGWIHLGVQTSSLYPAGVILPYAGSGALPFQGWLLCDGKSYPTATYPVLFGVIGYTYGGSGANFLVPDLRGRVVAGADNMGGTAAGRLTGATLAVATGAERITLATGELPAHAHGIADVAHNHGVSDPTHAHSVYDPGHAHGVADPGHGHGVNDGGHSHGVNDGGHNHQYYKARGSGNQSSGGGSDVYDTGDLVDTSWNSSNISINGSGANISIAGAGTGIGIYGAGTSIGIYGAGTGISLGASGTGLSTTQAAGSGGGHLNVQPTLTLNYIIKA
jgi:microcystin-dependent protein